MKRGVAVKKQEVLQKIEESPVIAAVKDYEGLTQCLTSDCSVVFVLFGDIMSIGGIVSEIKQAGKTALVHVDLINGLSAKEVSIDFIRNRIDADGIISTKQNLIKRAKELDMFTVMRFFVLDSMALISLAKQCQSVRPDCIEILPGLMPKIIQKISKEEHSPVIAGGLISDKEDILAALNAGAVAVSATKPEVWFL